MNKMFFILLICILLPSLGFAQSTMMGDADGNGSVTIIDALQVAQHSVGLTPSGFDEVAGDVNCSGNASINDALMIAQYYVGILDEFPCELPTMEPTTGPTTGPGDCDVPSLPSSGSLQTISELPDPFEFIDGSRMTRKDQWECRRQEIKALMEKFELGEMPPVPSSVSGSYSGGSLTVTVTENGKTISFRCSISGGSSSSPKPGLIKYGINGLASLSGLGVASINFPNNDIAQQADTSSRGRGKFYDIYGSSHSAGALIAWAWGVNCLVTALEKTPSAGIDPTRLAVTGCSRDGKGAIVAGAFVDRIALTLPQESGSGGAASWRVSDYQKSRGQNVQTASHIITENVWFSRNFDPFVNSVTRLPFDHHSLAALVAPRALLIIENTSMEWLGAESTFQTAHAAHMVWEALGIEDKMGFSQSGHSDHCGYPSSQVPELNAFVSKFLVGGGSGNTDVMKTDGGFRFDSNRWAPWGVPNLQ